MLLVVLEGWGGAALPVVFKILYSAKTASFDYFYMYFCHIFFTCWHVGGCFSSNSSLFKDVHGKCVRWCFNVSTLPFLCVCVCVCVRGSCGAALVAGMPLCAVPVHSGRWRAGGDGVQEPERRRLAPARRHEPLLERDQAQVPQHQVRRACRERQGFSDGVSVKRREWTFHLVRAETMHRLFLLAVGCLAAHSRSTAAYFSSPSSQQIHYWCYTVKIVVAWVLLSRGERLHAIAVVLWCLIGKCPGVPPHCSLSNSAGIPFKRLAP